MKIIVIVGATAVGKSDYAIEVAKNNNGEIINCDSIQIYKKLNIGSAKLSFNERCNVKHHLIDIKEPFEMYSVADFQRDARAAIADIQKRGKLPILCGGTGLYINATLYDYQFFDSSELKMQYEKVDNGTLYDNLLLIDKIEAIKIGKNNRNRLIQALITCKLSSNSKTDLLAEQSQTLLYDAEIINLIMPREILYNRINDRVDKMFADGLITEVQTMDAS